jgi:hypothetical protein
LPGGTPPAHEAAEEERLTMSDATAGQAETKGETWGVIGACYWGRGATLAEAKKNFGNQGGQLGTGYNVFDAETEFRGVDDMGRVHWAGNEPVRQEHAPRRARGVTVR